MMKNVSLDTWIQLIGIIGIIASLLFVGLEMRQSQKIALAAQQQERRRGRAEEAHPQHICGA